MANPLQHIYNIAYIASKIKLKLYNSLSSFFPVVIIIKELSQQCKAGESENTLLIRRIVGD